MKDGRPEVGLVLEGGAMRGLFTAGVLDVWLERGIRVDRIAAVSAGAAFGCNFVSGQAGRVLRYNLRYCRDWRYCSLRSLILTGDLYGADFCYRALPDVLDPFDRDAFNASETEFYAVCTDMDAGQAVYHRCETVDQACFDWIRASASMPFVSRMVTIQGKHLMDGGIADPIPFQWMEQMKMQKIVAVLTQPRDYVKKPARFLPAVRRALHAYPAAVDLMARRHIRYRQSRDAVFAAEAQGRAFVLCPPAPLPVGHVCHDRRRIQAAYDIGRSVAKETLDALETYLRR